MFSWSVLDTNRDKARTITWPSCWPSLNNGYNTARTACPNASSQATLVIPEAVGWTRESTTVYSLSEVAPNVEWNYHCGQQVGHAAGQCPRTVSEENQEERRFIQPDSERQFKPEHKAGFTYNHFIMKAG